MNPVLTFIIPVRHPDNSPDWLRLKRNLAQTVHSISRQKNAAWQAVIVANSGADLPPLPAGFSVASVTFPANQLHLRGHASQDDFYRAFRADKGRRVLVGLLHFSQLGHVMIVDDDDFVSNRLTDFVLSNPDSNGWFLERGYVWSDGGRMLYRYDDFSHLCGTSHIVRSDLYEVPESFDSADPDYIEQRLGSHIYLSEHLKSIGQPLVALPFAGAVYRVGHAGAHSGSSGIFQKYFSDRWLLRKPWELARRLSRLRSLWPSLDREFFGFQDSAKPPHPSSRHTNQEFR